MKYRIYRVSATCVTRIMGASGLRALSAAQMDHTAHGGIVKKLFARIGESVHVDDIVCPLRCKFIVECELELFSLLAIKTQFEK